MIDSIGSKAPVLCVFGTASDVGKSWLVTGLGRALSNRGVDVAPYKAQNLSNNAGVAPSGGELGRAQIVQAEACRLEPHVDMNPVLLKPEAEGGTQVVVLGQVLGRSQGGEYLRGGVEEHRRLVLSALDRLRARHALVIAEGAGSCAEVNLRARDLANFPVAHHADAPVLLVADIHRGGVFAQVVGSLEVLSAADRRRVAGVVVNRFRGDASRFEDGAAWLRARTGLPVSVVPWRADIRVDAEDALPVDAVVDPPRGVGSAIAVVASSRMANSTDFEPLRRLGVAVHYLTRPRDLGAYPVVVLPGSKSTRSDLARLRQLGWVPELTRYARTGRIWGICGGYQMLGRRIDDPDGVDGVPGSSPGLGLLDVVTTMAADKQLSRTRGWLGEVEVRGYEIHTGRTERGEAEPLLRLVERDGAAVHEVDGARSADGRHWGTYLHGLFDEPEAAATLLAEAGVPVDIEGLESAALFRNRQFDRLAEHLEQCLDVAGLLQQVGTAS